MAANGTGSLVHKRTVDKNIRRNSEVYGLYTLLRFSQMLQDG